MLNMVGDVLTRRKQTGTEGEMREYFYSTSQAGHALTPLSADAAWLAVSARPPGDARHATATFNDINKCNGMS